MKKYWVIILISGFIVLIGFNYHNLNQGVNAGNLPPYAQRTSAIEKAYLYTLERPDFLTNIPCYCNCYRMGHKSVKDCFIKEFKDDGKVIFEEHGANCGTCYSIVLDSKKLSEEGKTITEIRDSIDSKYSKYGLPTPTPRP